MVDWFSYEIYRFKEMKKNQNKVIICLILLNKIEKFGEFIKFKRN